jgi:hypothetical protein
MHNLGGTTYLDWTLPYLNKLIKNIFNVQGSAMALSFLLVQAAGHCYRARIRKGDILCPKDISEKEPTL